MYTRGEASTQSCVSRQFVRASDADVHCPALRLTIWPDVRRLRLLRRRHFVSLLTRLISYESLVGLGDVTEIRGCLVSLVSLSVTAEISGLIGIDDIARYQQVVVVW